MKFSKGAGARAMGILKPGMSRTSTMLGPGRHADGSVCPEGTKAVPPGWVPCCETFEGHTIACYHDIRYEWSAQHGWITAIAPDAGGGGIEMGFCPHCGMRLRSPNEQVPEHMKIADELMGIPAETAHQWVELAKRRGLDRMITEAGLAGRRSLLTDMHNTTVGWPNPEGLRAIMSFIETWMVREKMKP